MKKKVVTIGGGSGQSLLLQELKKYDVSISAVVSMIDNGGSTGVIRSDYKVLPSGDVRRCLIALAQGSEKLCDTMSFRFNDGFLKDHNFGNLLMLALEQKTGDYQSMIDYMHKLLNVEGRVIPVTLDESNLAAQLENGDVINGETNIDVPKHDQNLKIKKVYLEPDARTNPEALEAIKKADLIIYTIGDLYTSVIPNLLTIGIDEAIAQSKAKKVYTCNRTTKKGETQGFSVKDYVDTLRAYVINNSLDYVLVDENTSQPPSGYELVKLEEPAGVRVIKADLSTEEDRAHINGKKLAKAIWQLLS